MEKGRYEMRECSNLFLIGILYIRIIYHLCDMKPEF